MATQSWEQTLYSSPADGTAITNTTTEGSLLPNQAKIILPAGFLYYPGQTLRIKAAGRISNVVTTPGTLTLRVKFNSTPITVAQSGAIALNTTAKTNVTWNLDWDLVLRTVGAGTSATFMHVGTWTSESVVGAAAGAAYSASIPLSAPAVGTGFDSTIANLVDLSAQFSVSTATTSIQLHTYRIESIN